MRTGSEGENVTSLDHGWFDFAIFFAIGVMWGLLKIVEEVRALLRRAQGHWSWRIGCYSHEEGRCSEQEGLSDPPWALLACYKLVSDLSTKLKISRGVLMRCHRPVNYGFSWAGGFRWRSFPLGGAGLSS